MLDINTLRPKAAELAPRQGRTAKDRGPNHWLNPEWEYNLQNSYDQATAFSVEVEGERVEGVIEKGARKGAPTTKLTGDAADAVALIREASELLGLGVAIQDSPARRKGFVTITYQARKRKQRNTTPKPTEETVGLWTSEPASE